MSETRTTMLGTTEPPVCIRCRYEGERFEFSRLYEGLVCFDRMACYERQLDREAAMRKAEER